MIIKYIDDRGTTILTTDDDDEDDEWALYVPTQKEQLWMPAHGLYEVILVRWMMLEDPYIEVKISLIRKTL